MFGLDSVDITTLNMWLNFAINVAVLIVLVCCLVYLVVSGWSNSSGNNKLKTISQELVTVSNWIKSHNESSDMLVNCYEKFDNRLTALEQFCGYQNKLPVSAKEKADVIIPATKPKNQPIETKKRRLKKTTALF
ncbi:MAG: hypothetical protein LBP59_10660 [Planctomycetaceae bacterium]|jgi:hypothetical protein|nr:hypothetical protein [Planctomycetaceae bacterium]